MKFLHYCFLLLLPVLLVPFVLLVPLARASSPQAYQDYLYQFDLYRRTYSEFTIAKNEYEKFKSLTSQTTALKNTTAMLSQRDKLLRAYLLLLNEKINENQGFQEARKIELRGLVTAEITFLDAHNNRVGSISSLDDATARSQELESHYRILQTILRQTVINISLGDLSALTHQFDTALSQSQELVTASKSTFAPQKQATIDRWLLQIQNVRQLYQQKIADIEGKNNKLKDLSLDGLDGAFRDIKGDLGQAKKYLTDGHGFIGELIEALRYQN